LGDLQQAEKLKKVPEQKDITIEGLDADGKSA
jgi:hypothetical protein